MLSFSDVGDGPPVLFVHAGIADRRMWQPQVDLFSRRWRVVCPDLRGFGCSDHDDEPFRHSWDLAALLDGLGISDAVVVGASMGGAASIDLALERPDLVRALVLVGSVYDGFEFRDDDLFARWRELDAIAGTGDLDQAARAEASIWLGDATAPDVRHQVVAMIRRSYDHGEIDQTDVAVPARDRLDLVEVPTMVLVGDQDRPDIRCAGEELARQIPNTTFFTIPGAAHLPSFEQPLSFNDLLSAFVEEGG
jgi:pimeloyl-ACP methyl ester carboxylesterase